MTILHERVEVCSKRLGGCGKEISDKVTTFSSTSYSVTGKGIPWSGTLDESMIGITFTTRDGTVAKLTKIEKNTALSTTYYPCTFTGDNGVQFTTTPQGRFNMHSQHPKDIVKIL